MRSSSRNSASADDEDQVIGQDPAVERDAEDGSRKSTKPGRSSCRQPEGAAVLAAGQSRQLRGEHREGARRPPA